jgi:hypothetical protein
MPPPLLAPRTKKGDNTKIKFTNRDLPVGCTDGNVWRRAFVPTYIRFIASLKNPWTIDDDTAIQALQTIWDAIYGQTIQHAVTADDAVFHIVSRAQNGVVMLILL